MKPITPIYMSVTDAAKRYGIGRTLMYEILAMNEAPKTLKLKSKRLLPIAEFDAFMADAFSSNN